MNFVMAEKRAAISDLNQTNWDKEDSPESSSSCAFKTAPTEELRNRVIKTARRKIASSSETAANKTVFSGFTGFKNVTTSPVTTTASPFSFLNKISSTPATSPVKNSLHKPTKDYSKLKGLNQSVMEWIKKHVDESPICILSPIFKDYENYVKEILADEDVSQKEVNKSTNNEPENSTNVSLTSSANVPAKTFSFGTSITKPSVNETGTSSSPGIFSNIKPPASTSIFGSPGTFQFGKTNTTSITSAVSPTTGFSFTNSKPFSFAGSVSNQNLSSLDANKSEAVEDEENEEPPKNEFKAVVEEDSVFSKRCKVFVKHDGNYNDRGVGTLYLKPIKDKDKTQLLVRADTNLGNILLNFILSEGLPCQRMGKNNVMIVCIPTPESEQKPTSVLLRVKTGAEADQLLDTINKYKK